METKKRALITGITGQDGSYLAEFLLEKGYEVHGIIRRASSFITDRIDHIYKDPHQNNVNLFLHYGDMTDSSNMNRLLEKVNPHEIYNLAAQSHVKVSFEVPEYTAETDALGTLRILDAIKDVGINPKFYQASTSELYGQTPETPQNEQTAFYPRSPYACAKLYAYWTTVNYREAYDIFACNGILFNHESPLRGETFVSRKITRALARIVLGLQDTLYLGNLGACRDWGHARDYVEAMWSMLQQQEPEDYVIATGEQHSVRDFVTQAAAHLGIGIEWQHKGSSESGVISSFDEDQLHAACIPEDDETNVTPSAELTPGRTIVKVDPRYFRPTEVNALQGDASKAKERLPWRPSTTFSELVQEMVDADLREARRDALCRKAGFQVFDYHE